MKKIDLILTILCSTIVLGCSQTSDKANQSDKDLEEGIENEGFGGVGADPTSGTTVSEDTAASISPDSVSVDSLPN